MKTEKLKDFLLGLLFPPRCAFCRKVLPTDTGICGSCEASLPWTGTHAATDSHSRHFSRIAAPLYYEKEASAALKRYKFYGRVSSAKIFSRLVAECADEQFGGKFDLITWVPISAKRLKKRGYDQSELLARGAARLLNVQCERLLHKVTDTPAQSGLKGTEKRRANVLDAYRLCEDANISGRRILLIDDVFTTGATAAECSKVLRRGGAADILCLALMRSRRQSVKKH